jgi:hypothetical protein
VDDQALHDRAQRDVDRQLVDVIAWEIGSQAGVERQLDEMPTELLGSVQLVRAVLLFSAIQCNDYSCDDDRDQRARRQRHRCVQ